MPDFARSREETIDQCLPEGPASGLMSGPWSANAQGSLGNAAMLERMGGGYNFGLSGLGLMNGGLSALSPFGGMGLGADLFSLGRLTSSMGQTATEGGGVMNNFNAAFSPLSAQGLNSNWNLGGFGANTNIGDAYMDRLNFDGSMGYDANGALNSMGFDANYTPFGMKNASSTLNMGPFGQTSASVGDAYYGRQGLKLNTGVADDGTINSDATYYQRMGVENASVTSSNALGSTTLSGSYGTGPRTTGGVSYNPNTGSMEARGGWAGGGYAVKNAGLQGNYLGGNVNVNGSVGEWNTANSYDGAVGWDAVNQQAYGRGHVSTGNTLTNANLGYDIGGGAMGGNAHVGEWIHGNNFAGDVRIGSDGVHFSSEDIGNLGENKGIRFGGHQVNDVRVGSHLGDFAHTDASLGHFSNDNLVDNAHLDITGRGVHGDFEQIRAGGMRGENLSVGGDFLGQSSRLNVGSASNDTILDGGQFNVTRDGVDASLKNMRTGGFRANNLSAQQSFLGTDSHASVGEISNDVLLQNAYMRRNHLGTQGEAGFGTLDFGGVRVLDVNGGFNNDTLGINGDYGMGSFTNGNTIKGARADWDMTSLDTAHLNAHADEIGALGMDINNTHFNVNGPMGTNVGGSLDSFHTGLSVKDANASLDLQNGLQLSAGSAGWDTYSGQNLNLNADLGPLYQGSAHIGEGYYNRFRGENLQAGLDGNGLHASGDNLGYNYLGFNDVQLQSSQFGGMLGSSLNADKIDVGSVNAGHLDYQSNLLNTSLAVQDLRASGLRTDNLNLGTNVGDLGANVGARQLNALDLRVGDANAHSEMFGLSGGANVNNANLDLLNVQGGHAGLGWGGREFLGATGDYRAGGGVENANADWNLLNGTANANFQNAHFGQQLSNSSVNLFGTDIALPDAGYNVNASGGGNVDLSRGQANANMSLAGSSVNFAGHELTLGDWAQASGGVDLSQGAANANLGGQNGLSAGVNLSQGAANLNLGGENGVGADVNLSEGNLDLNLFGTKIDVDQGIRDAGSAVADFFSGW